MEEMIRARLDSLTKQRQEAQQQALLLQRNIDAMMGGEQELTELLTQLEQACGPLFPVTHDNDVGVG